MKKNEFYNFKKKKKKNLDYIWRWGCTLPLHKDRQFPSTLSRYFLHTMAAPPTDKLVELCSEVREPLCREESESLLEYSSEKSCISFRCCFCSDCIRSRRLFWSATLSSKSWRKINQNYDVKTSRHYMCLYCLLVHFIPKETRTHTA